VIKSDCVETFTDGLLDVSIKCISIFDDRENKSLGNSTTMFLVYGQAGESLLVVLPAKQQNKQESKPLKFFTVRSKSMKCFIAKYIESFFQQKIINRDNLKQ